MLWPHQGSGRHGRLGTHACICVGHTGTCDECSEAPHWQGGRGAPAFQTKFRENTAPNGSAEAPLSTQAVVTPLDSGLGLAARVSAS